MHTKNQILDAKKKFFCWNCLSTKFVLNMKKKYKKKIWGKIETMFMVLPKKLWCAHKRTLIFGKNANHTIS